MSNRILLGLFALLACHTTSLAQTRTICIDPGHPSEVNSGDQKVNGTSEVKVAWAVAKRLEILLKERGFKVVMTKSTEMELVRNRRRAEIANEARADLMIRLHCDSSSDSGYAVYYPDREGTAQGKTGPSVKVRDASKRAAEIVASALRTVLKDALKNGGVRGDSKTLIGGKQGALTGSIFSEIAVLTVEMVVLNHKADATFIKSDSGQALMARALADGVEAYCKSLNSTQKE